MKFIKLFVLACIISTASANTVFAQDTIQTKIDSTKTITVKVKGISCSKDLKMISTNVEKLEGVNSCEASKMGPTSSFEVKYNPALVTKEEIYSAVENTGGCSNSEDRPYKVKK